MNQLLGEKLRTHFPAMTIYKDPSSINTIFAGRNLPSFVKDFLIKRYINERGEIDKGALTDFMNKVIRQDSIKGDLDSGAELTLLTRFIVDIDLVHNVRRFSIPDLGIKSSEGQIPKHIYTKYKDVLGEGEMWGIIKICVMPDDNEKTNHVEMVDFKPFKPYRSVDLSYFAEGRRAFSTSEWIDVLLSAMEYDSDGFDSISQKLEFLSRLLIFVEPRLNMIELAPKGTGKSYVFGNLSKYGWMVSGGKVTRAKLFFDKQKQRYGIMKDHDFAAFDEIQTIVFQEPMEIQAALKSYLESGRTTIDNNEFVSDCGLMLMGNIPLNDMRRPACAKYFDTLPVHFKESALLDRFHGFIEGWLLPNINTSMIFKGWTFDVEYFSEIMHKLRTSNQYAILYKELVKTEPNAYIRDCTAVQRLAVAYMKLLFPHWSSKEDVNYDEFEQYCLRPAIHRRAIIREQRHLIDPEVGVEMPEFKVEL